MSQEDEYGRLQARLAQIGRDRAVAEHRRLEAIATIERLDEELKAAGVDPLHPLEEQARLDAEIESITRETALALDELEKVLRGPERQVTPSHSMNIELS